MDILGFEPDPASRLSPGHQLLASRAVLAEEIPALLDALASGALPFNPDDRDEAGRPALYHVLTCGARDFSRVRPLAQWLQAQGQSPWDPIGPKGLSLYQLLLERNPGLQAPMEWCLHQPGAPALGMPSVSEQVLYDRLRANVLSHDSPASHRVLQEVLNLDMDLFEVLSNGVRPLDVVLEQCATSHAFAGCHAQGQQPSFKQFEWTDLLRDITRLGREVLRHDPGDPAALRIRAIAWAHAFHASRCFAAVHGFPASAPEPDRPSWQGTVERFDRDLATCLGWPGKDPARLAVRLHAASLDALLSAPSPPALGMALEATMAHLWMRDRYFRKQAQPGSRKSKASDELLEVAARLAPHMDAILADEKALMTAWAEAWQRIDAGSGKTGPGATNEGVGVPSMDPRFWLLAVPAWIHHRRLDASRGVLSPARPLSLFTQLRGAGAWPDTPAWNAAVERWPWSQEVAALAASRRLDAAIPESTARSLPHARL